MAGEEIFVINDVDAVTNVEMIDIVAAAQKVLARATEQSVDMRAFVEVANAEQCVVTSPAKQKIRSGSAIDHIIAAARTMALIAGVRMARSANRTTPKSFSSARANTEKNKPFPKRRLQSPWMKA